MNWFRKLDTVVRRVIVGAAIALLLVLVLLVVGFCKAREEAATARFEGRVADAQAGLGSDAAKTTADRVAAEQDNAAQTGRNREDILDAQNANDSAGDAGDRGLRALCGRVQYRDSVRCVELRRADRADASR